MKQLSLTPRDLEMFTKGMDAAILLLDETVPKVANTRLVDILERAGVEITIDTKSLTKLWNLLLSSVLAALVQRVKIDSKKMFQELTYMTHEVDPEHMQKLADAARDAGIDPGAWRRA